MIGRAAALVLGAALLAGCGTVQTPAQALRGWVRDSGFAGAVTTLRTDARDVANVLREPNPAAGRLRLVCAVLLVDAQTANASLPTTDDQVSHLLATAYGDLGAAAHLGYGARGSVERTRALRELERGVATMAEAQAAVAAVVG